MCGDCNCVKYKVAVPTEGTGGLDAGVSGHFGRSDCYTIVQVCNGRPEETTILMNSGEGQCGGQVHSMQNLGVDTVITSCIGMRPLELCLDHGMQVYLNATGTVNDAIQAMLAGKLPKSTEVEVSCHTRDAKEGPGHRHHHGGGHGHAGSCHG